MEILLHQRIFQNKGTKTVWIGDAIFRTDRTTSVFISTPDLGTWYQNTQVPEPYKETPNELKGCTLILILLLMICGSMLSKLKINKVHIIHTWAVRSQAHSLTNATTPHWQPTGLCFRFQQRG